MSAHQHGPHGHPHDHDHDGPLPSHLDPTVADGELSPAELDRRAFLRRAGLAGAGVAATAALTGAVGGTASAAPGPGRDGGSRSGGYLWLSGDHHIHTQYSSDAQYRVLDQVSHASQHGLDWMVITDHGSVAHCGPGERRSRRSPGWPG